MIRSKLALCAALAAFGAGAPACHRPTTARETPAALSDAQAPARAVQPDVIYVPTPPAVVEEMLRLADVKPADVVYDLGCGDGRIVIGAAKRGARKAVGVDIDPERIQEAWANARAAGVAERVSFVQADLFEVDFSDADVVTLYLLPQLNLRLRPKLLSLHPGARIVSHAFDMGDWKPEVTRVVDGKEVFAWTVPERPRVQARTPTR